MQAKHYAAFVCRINPERPHQWKVAEQAGQALHHLANLATYFLVMCHSGFNHHQRRTGTLCHQLRMAERIP